jgi:hypothetical protein
VGTSHDNRLPRTSKPLDAGEQQGREGRLARFSLAGERRDLARRQEAKPKPG